MTQPIDLIQSALTSIGALAPGEPLESSLAQEAFMMLNDMLDMWSNDDFMITSLTEIVQTIGGGGTDWTIGPSGQINSVRPLNINSAFVRVATIDYPVVVINVEQYELIGLKQLSGPWPRVLFYNSGTPLGTLKFWPNPSQGEIHLFIDQPFTRFTTINDTINFTPGYNMAMRWSLAELLMPGYGKTDPALAGMVSKFARNAIASIKGTNMQPVQTMQFDPAMCSGVKTKSWIYSGGFG